MTPKKIGTNTNVYDTVYAQVQITLNSSTWNRIFLENEDRIGYKITNLSAQTILILEDDPGADQSDRGFGIWARTVYETKELDKPTGPVFGKTINGTADILATEE